MEFAKVCSDDLVELEAWASGTVGGQLSPCGACKPMATPASVEAGATQPGDGPTALDLPTAAHGPAEDRVADSQRGAEVTAAAQSFELVCPNGNCHAQGPYAVDVSAVMQHLRCLSCGRPFKSRIVKIRSASSARVGHYRRFKVRVWDLSRAEALIEFDRDPYGADGNSATIEMRSGDRVAFTYVSDLVAVVQNLTIGRWTEIVVTPHPPPTTSGGCCVLMALVLAGLPALLVTVGSLALR